MHYFVCYLMYKLGRGGGTPNGACFRGEEALNDENLC